MPRTPAPGLHHVTMTMFQGELEITTEAGSGKAKEPNAAGQVADVVDRVPFLFLGLDLPAAPLYKDVMETNIIPQVGPPSHPHPNPPSHATHLATCLFLVNTELAICLPHFKTTCLAFRYLVSPTSP